MNYKDFSAKIKEKHPGSYDSVDDLTLAKKMVEKYPEYSSKVEFDKTEPQSDTIMSFVGDVAKKGFAQALQEAIVKPTGALRKTTEKVLDSPALPIAGATIGGALSAPTGPGSIAGAALGGAAGEAYRQMAAKAMGIKSPETSLEAAKDIGIEGATQAVGEGVGRFIVAPTAKAIGSVLKKPAGDLFQIVTKIKPEDAATLFKNPKAILPKTWAKAKEAWKTAAKAAGIDIDEVSVPLINALKTDAKETVFNTFERLQQGESVTAGQVQLAKQAMDIGVMPAAKNERNKPLIAILTKMRNTFTEALGKESPELAAANKEYAIAKAGSKFRSFFPRNSNESPAYFRSSVLPSILFGMGANRGEPGEGLLQGAAVGLGSSPLAIGSLIAGAGAVRPFARPLARTATASLANLASRYLQDRGQQQ